MTRKRLIAAAQVILSAVILWLLFRHMDPAMLLHSFSRLTLPTLLVLLLTALLKFLLDYLNWYWYLRLDPTFRPRHWDALRSHTIGMALRFTIPGGHGAWGKMFFVQNSKAMTAISVGVERFLLTWSNALFGVLAGVFFFTGVALWVRLAVLGGTLVLPWAAWLVWRAWKHQSELPGRYLVLLPRVVLTRGLFMLITVLQYWLLLRSIAPLPVAQCLVAVPLILFANAIPITYSGLGLREGFAMQVLGSMGVSPEAAVTTSLTVFLVNTVLPALPGALLIALHRPKKAEKD